MWRNISDQVIRWASTRPKKVRPLQRLARCCSGWSSLRGSVSLSNGLRKPSVYSNYFILNKSMKIGRSFLEQQIHYRSVIDSSSSPHAKSARCTFHSPDRLPSSNSRILERAKRKRRSESESSSSDWRNPVRGTCPWTWRNQVSAKGSGWTVYRHPFDGKAALSAAGEPTDTLLNYILE